MTKILAVDDEPDVLLIVQTGLEVEGFEVVTAKNGLEAIEQAKAELPDLILLDVMMPEKDGFEVLAELKEDDKTATIPVIMLTGVSDKSKIQNALMTGTEYYIVKPFDFDELLTKIRQALNG